MGKLDYLFKYTDAGADGRKKKKRKKKKIKAGDEILLKDEDDGLDVFPVGQEYEDDQDLPTVVPIDDPSTVETNRSKQQWEDVDPGVRRQKLKEESHLISRRRYDSDEEPHRKRYDSDDDPPRRNTSGAEHVEARAKRHDSDVESPSVKRHDSDVGGYSRKKSYGSDDDSPSHRRRHDSDYDSPPCRQRYKSENEAPKGRRRLLNSEIPKRKRYDSDEDSPSRRKRYDSDDERPRRRRPYSNSESLTRKLENPDDSFGRRRTLSDSDDESVIRRKQHGEIHRRKRYDSDEDASPSLNGHKNGTQVKREWSPYEGGDSERSTQENLCREGVTREKMSSGHVAGLQQAIDFRSAEQVIQKERRKEAQAMVDEHGMGETVYRDDLGRQVEEIKRKKLPLMDEEEQAQLNKGRVQKEDDMRFHKEFEDLQKSKFARHADDDGLEAMRKDIIRKGDPMAAYALKIKAEKGARIGKPKNPEYKGPPPKPNRFGIRPGYRWDGVDRGNGFEDRVLASKYSTNHKKEQAYRWSTSDM